MNRKTRLQVPLLLALSLLASASLAQQPAPQAARADDPNVGNLRAHVRYLASDELAGRRTGSTGAQKAAAYVEAEFKRLGLRPGATTKIDFNGGRPAGNFASYLQPFPYVAAVELARILSTSTSKPRRTVVFVAFGGEEEGLIGSSYYVKHPTVPLAQTVAMVNMDMIGRLRDGKLTVGGVGTAAEWRKVVEDANTEMNLKVNVNGVPAAQRVPGDVPVVTGSNGVVIATANPKPRFTLALNEDGYGPSDHSSFYARRVPVLFVWTGTHEDYHKPTDTADSVNYEGLALVASFVRDVVREIDDSGPRPTFTVAKSDPSAGRRVTSDR